MIVDLIPRELNLDLLWLRDSALANSENLLEPEALAAEIVEELAALVAFPREHESSVHNMA